VPTLTKIPRFPFKILLILVVSLVSFMPPESVKPSYVISFKEEIQNFSIDRYEMLYVAESNGDIHKIDTLGNKLLTWSPQKKAS
jgi:hypothetical protein